MPEKKLNGLFISQSLPLSAPSFLASNSTSSLFVCSSTSGLISSSLWPPLSFNMPFDFFWGEGGEGGVDGEGEAAKDEGEQVKADLHRGEGE